MLYEEKEAEPKSLKPTGGFRLQQSKIKRQKEALQDGVAIIQASKSLPPDKEVAR
jgi:hypothetical protein